MRSKTSSKSSSNGKCTRYSKGYFYVYENKVYVNKCLLSSKTEKDFTKDEIREFKRMYCYLSRIESHNINENYMYYRLAEYIWRHEKSFEELYRDLVEIIHI